MSTGNHAAVWLDGKQARIVRFEGGEVRTRHIRAEKPGNTRDDREYYEAILAELTEVDGWLIAGPTATRNDFEKYVRGGHAEALAKKLVGTEAMEDFSDGELRIQARRRFAKAA